MNGGYGITFPAILSALALAPGCSSSSSHAGTTGLVACDDYFDAIAGIACDATTPPANEVARIRALFETSCQNDLALPGNGVTPASIEACAAAIKRTGCGEGDLDVPECNFQGSLPDGAPCNESSQCQSGDCHIATTGTNDGGASTPPCGTCIATVLVGQTCATGDTCEYGAVCAPNGSGYACALVVYGDVGAGCDGLAAECKTGLYCNVEAMQCASPGGAGAGCSEPLACTPPLACAGGTPGAGSTCQNPGLAGAPCQAAQDCASGLGCSTVTMQCTAITWVSQGQHCGDVDVCLVGVCPLTGGAGGPANTGGTCPTVIADGQPCISGDPTQTCDTFSTCTFGLCVRPDSVACQ